VRGDLAPGLQASQAVHAAQLYALEHAQRHAEWHAASNTIAIKSAPDADALDALQARAASAGVPVSAFVDDDLGPRLTSIALGPGSKAAKFCWTLPLAFSTHAVEVVNTG
jgi:hypothetical protein